MPFKFNPFSGNFDEVSDVSELVTGPASATDNAIVRYDGTTGKLVQDSLVTVSDTGVVTAGADGVASLDLVTKQQLDAIAGGVSVKQGVVVATTADITLSGEQTIDGVLTSASRVLVKNQTDQTENGIYVSDAGAWTRSTDMDVGSEFEHALVTVAQGSTQANSGWYQITDSVTVGVSNIVFNQFFGAGTYVADGQGIELSGSTFSLELDGSTLAKSSAGLKVATSGITDNEVSATAQIARSKLADGSADRLVINDASGGMVDAAAINPDFALVSDANGIPTHSAVSTTELNQLQGVVSSVQQQLNSGNVNFVGLNSTWELENPDDRTADVSVGNWLAYADAAASIPVDMTGGSPNTSIARTTTAGEVLNGAGSFELTKNSGASRQGEGVSVLFNMPPAYQGKPCVVKFPFRVTSGSIVEGDFKVFLYDVTNSVVIAPFANDLIGSQGTLTAQFISSSPAGTPANQQYRVGIHIASTTDSSVTIAFDDVSVEPEVVAYGATVNRDSITLSGYNGKGATNTVIMRFDSIQDSSLNNGFFTYADSASDGMSITVNKSCFARIRFGFTSNEDTNNHFAGISKNSNQLTTAITSITAANRLAASFVSQTVSTRANPTAYWAGYLVAGDVIRAHTSTGTLPEDDAGTYFSFEAEEVINNPITSAQQFRISNYLANGTRVTATPTALGQYRSLIKNNASRTFSDTAPTDAPSAANGMHIYATGGTGAGTANQPNRYQIYIGTNKTFKLETFSSTGRTGFLSTDYWSDGSTIEEGLITMYDPVTGVLDIATPVRVTGSTNRYIGRSSTSGTDDTDSAANGYFDILVSEKINTVQFNPYNNEVLVTTGNGYGSTNTKIRRFSTISKNTGSAITYADSATLGSSFTINEDGVYSVSYCELGPASAYAMGISLNSTQLTTNIQSITDADIVVIADGVSSGRMSVSQTLNLRAGDIIRPHGESVSSNTTTSVRFRITKVS